MVPSSPCSHHAVKILYACRQGQAISQAISKLQMNKTEVIVRQAWPRWGERLESLPHPPIPLASCPHLEQRVDMVQQVVQGACTASDCRRRRRTPAPRTRRAPQPRPRWRGQTLRHSTAKP